VRAPRSRASRPAPEIEIPSYHGIHVAPLQSEHVRIAWHHPTRRSDRARVRRHTCDCKATIYELCHSGGLLYIRRTVRDMEGYVIRETERLITVRMEDLWNKLILGQAR
jgi:hypothetical protein